jgi:hypothetical protein
MNQCANIIVTTIISARGSVICLWPFLGLSGCPLRLFGLIPQSSSLFHPPSQSQRPLSASSFAVSLLDVYTLLALVEYKLHPLSIFQTRNSNLGACFGTGITTSFSYSEWRSASKEILATIDHVLARSFVSSRIRI